MQINQGCVRCKLTLQDITHSVILYSRRVAIQHLDDSTSCLLLHLDTSSVELRREPSKGH